LFDVATGNEIQKAALPAAPLGHLTAGTVSGDLNWLAMSQKRRGGVWDVRTGEEVQPLRAFSGAYFDPAGAFYADLNKLPNLKRAIGQLTLPNAHFEQKREIDETVHATQHGRYMLGYIPAKDHYSLDSNVTLVVYDVRDAKPMWSRYFHGERPDGWITAESGILILYWPVGSKAIKSVVNSDLDAAAKLNQFPDKKGVFLLQVINLDSGAVQSSVAIDTGRNSFVAKAITVSGNHIVLFDDQNRVLLYTLDGKRQASLPGRGYSFSSDLLLVNEEAQAERLALYDLSTAQKRSEYIFESPVIFSDFSADGKRLLVVTANQMTYLIDSAAPRDVTETVSK
jgi:hypothetical protein